MSKKPKKPEMFVELRCIRYNCNRYGTSLWHVHIAWGTRRAKIIDSGGDSSWVDKIDARRVADEWAENLGLEVREKA